MPHLLRVLFAAIALYPLVGLAAEPILVYERVHRQVAHQDNAVRLVVYDDNRVEATFPFYSPNAGTRSWRISPEERAALLELAAPVLELQTDRLQQSINTRSTGDLMVVTDADRVTVELRDPARGSSRVVAPSPEIWARELAEGSAMETFARVAGELADWMRENAGEESHD